MDPHEATKIKKRLEALRNQFTSIGPFMRGSVVVIGTRNKQPYFSINKDKKTRLIYLGKGRLERARVYSANYHTLLAIIDEMTLLTMELIKADIDL
jgi:hypothetical protein